MDKLMQSLVSYLLPKEITLYFGFTSTEEKVRSMELLKNKTTELQRFRNRQVQGGVK